MLYNRIMRQLPGTSLWGMRRDDGGHCDGCDRDRLVLWVEELGGFRCSSCLCPQSRRDEYHSVRKEDQVGPGPTIQEILQKLQDGGLLEAPTPVEEVPTDTPPARPN